MNKTRKYIFIISLAIFILSSVFVSIESVTTSAELVNLKKKEESLALEKRQLESQFVKYVSVSNLQSQSGNLGFVEAKNLMYVGEGEKVAIKN